MRKIMFSDKFGLTQAVLDGRKTMTRRIVPKSALDKVEEYQTLYYSATFDHIPTEDALLNMATVEQMVKNAYRVGEIVAVAQPYCKLHISAPTKDEVLNGEEITSVPAWTNKMFVKADLMPNRIRITDIKCERLQDISDEDCLKEGIYKDYTEYGDCLYWFSVSHKGITWKEYVKRSNELSCHEMDGKKGNYFWDSPQKAFARLIDKVSGKGTWDSNPYVFAYSFELLEE